MQITGNKTPYSLYFHIPFCTKKCPYCHFFVLPNKEELKLQYMESLQSEWQARLPQLKEAGPLVSIYFGGGTPALLGPDRIAQILEWISLSCSIDESVEITLEANPENVDLELMQSYRKAGINRASLGIQSMDDSLLIGLGRTHSARKGIEAVEATASAGILNISIDLMYDLPDQNLANWQKTLEKVFNLPITHLSLYNLTIEPQTVYFKKRQEIIPKLPEEQISLQMYEQAIATLGQAGLNQYEISAFARKNFRAVHNSGYWTGRSFIGFGPSAFSYWNNRRFKNVSNLNAYSKQLKDNLLPIDFEEELDPQARIRELLTINLRLLEGVDLNTFPALEFETIKVLGTLDEQGFIERDGSKVRLTRKGMLFYDSVAAELI